VFAPTGSGKTLALPRGHRRLMFARSRPRRPLRIVYVSPSGARGGRRAELRTPIAGMARVAAAREAVHFRTSASAPETRRRGAGPDAAPSTGHPDHDARVLFLLLTSRARAFLESVETVIVDEIHAVVGTKRGAHLALTLERLEEVARRRSSGSPLGDAAPPRGGGRYLGGARAAGLEAAAVTSWTPARGRCFDLRVEVPVEDMARLGEALPPGPRDPEGPASLLQRRSSGRPSTRLLELVRPPVHDPLRELAPPGRAPGGALNELRERRSPAPTTGRSPATSGSRSRTRSRLAAFPPSWPPRRSSWASTWALSTSWSRSRPHVVPAGCSGSVGRATR